MFALFMRKGLPLPLPPPAFCRAAHLVLPWGVALDAGLLGVGHIAEFYRIAAGGTRLRYLFALGGGATGNTDQCLAARSADPNACAWVRRT